MPRKTPGRLTAKQQREAQRLLHAEQDAELDFTYGFETESPDGGELANLLLDILALALADRADALLEKYADRPAINREGLYRLDNVLYRVLRSATTARLYAMKVQDGRSEYAKGVIYRLRPMNRVQAGRENG